jgi:hypothetical protein
MVERLKLRYFVVIIAIIIFILLFLGYIYIFSVAIPKESLQTNSGPKPYQILTPDVYTSGTIVSLYKEIPPIFPKEVVLENKTLDYSGTVTSPQGQMQITVSYVSDKSMKDAVNFYTKYLPGVGWTIAETSVYDKVSVIKTTKGKQNILMSVAPLQKGGTMVTFQYEE